MGKARSDDWTEKIKQELNIATIQHTWDLTIIVTIQIL